MMKTHTHSKGLLSHAVRTLAVGLTLGASLTHASAKTYTVKNLDDAGNGSLRSVLLKLESSHDGSNTITFKSGLNGIITLASPLPAIEKSVSITGPGANKIKVTAFNGGAFNVVAGVVSLSGLTIEGRGNDASAVVRNQFAVLTIEECVITGKSPSNQTGLINEIGGTTLINSSAVVDNSCTADGGGIRNRGTLTLINSTLANNRAGRGAALFNETTATTTLTNSTVADNNATIAGGGIFNDGGSVNLGNTIVARNVAGAATDDVRGFFASSGHNLIGSTAGSSGFGATDITNIAIGSLGFAATIAVNQGPTPTLALLAGSPAIDGGDNALALDGDGSTLAFDQRGSPFARIAGAAVDVGAFESNIAPAPEDARAYKQRALMTISACLPSCDPINAFYLRWAANRISASLQSWLWIDGDHVSSYGFFVFIREQQAVWYLKKVTGPCAASAQSAIDDLVYADEKIAAAALNAASGAPGENYARALNAYNEGVAAAASGNEFRAISWYSWAWWYATKALNKATVYDDEAEDYRYCEAN
jgi:hypothetical protein